MSRRILVPCSFALWLATLAGPAMAPGARHTPAGPSVPCPDDLAVTRGKLSIDSRPPPAISPEAQKRKKFVPGNGDPMPDTFALAAAEAVTRYVDLEAKSSDLIPAGFRSAVAATPRDPELRLRMARCEVAQPQTRRRAVDDAALAVLLGTPKASVAKELMASALQHRILSLTSGQTHCPSGKGTYEPEQHDCVTDDVLQLVRLSPPEAALEDALSRGLFGMRAKLPPGMLTAWGRYMLHACSGHECHLMVLSTGAILEQDLRDGGNTGQGSHDAATEKKNKRCKDATGSESLEECKTMCHVQGLGAHEADCVVKCQANCEPHG